MLLDRIKEIADNESISLTQLEKILGAGSGVLTKAYKNETDIQSKWLASIAEKYPLYNLDWLVTGNGNMLKEIGQETNESKNLQSLTLNLINENGNLREEIGRLKTELDVLKKSVNPYAIPCTPVSEFMAAEKEIKYDKEE